MTRELTQDTINFNNSWKDVYAERLFDKRYCELTGQEMLDVDDIIRGNNE